MLQDGMCGRTCLFFGALLRTNKYQDPVFVFNPIRLISKLSCGEIGLDTTGKGEQRAAQLGKPNRRSNNKIVTGFKIGIHVLQIVIDNAAWSAPAMAAVKTRADIVKVRRYDPNITL